MTEKRPPIEISLLLDGRLSPAEEAEWKAKIAADPAVRRGFESFRSTTEIIQAGSGLSELPPGFDARLRARLRTEELTSRARQSARAAAGPESWWQRVAMGLGGLAAGVAIMLAIGPTPLEGEPPTFRPFAATETVVNLPGQIPDGARLAPSEVRALASQKARALEQLSRTVRSAGAEITPVVLLTEMEVTGLRGQEQGLLANARAYSKVVGDDTVLFLEAADAVTAALELMIQRAKGGGQTISATEATRLVTSALELSAMLPASERGVGVHAMRSTATPAAGTETAAYAVLWSAYNSEDYWSAAGHARQFLETWPSSQLAGSVCRCGALSLQRLGDAAGALRLLDAVSQRRPSVVLAFGREELHAMRVAAVGESGRPGWVSDGDGAVLSQRPATQYFTQNFSQNIAPGLFTAMANQVNSLLDGNTPAEQSYRNVWNRMVVQEQEALAIESIQQFRNSQAGQGYSFGVVVPGEGSGNGERLNLTDRERAALVRQLDAEMRQREREARQGQGSARERQPAANPVSPE